MDCPSRPDIVHTLGRSCRWNFQHCCGVCAFETKPLAIGAAIRLLGGGQGKRRRSLRWPGTCSRIRADKSSGTRSGAAWCAPEPPIIGYQRAEAPVALRPADHRLTGLPSTCPGVVRPVGCLRDQ